MPEIKIVILDDEQAMLDACVETLVKKGFDKSKIFATTIPHIAGNVVKTDPNVEVMISDFQLSNFTFGNEIIGSLNAEGVRPDVKYILMSKAQAHHLAKEVGAYFLPKAHLDGLAHLVKSLMRVEA